MNDNVEMMMAYKRAFPTVITVDDAMRQALSAANLIELYRSIIRHMWANHQNCGSQTCALCTEAYRVYNEEYQRMSDDE